MSGTASAHPQPVSFGDADPSDSDVYALDCRQAMAARADKIADVALDTIWRSDGAPMQSADFGITNLAVIPGGTSVPLPSGPLAVDAGTFVSWRGAGGIAGSSYLAKLVFSLASGNSINRTVMINTPDFIG